MKTSIVCLGIKTAALIALTQSNSFDIVDVCSNSDEVKKIHCDNHGCDFGRDFKMRRKSIERKKQRKPARGGGKP